MKLAPRNSCLRLMTAFLWPLFLISTAVLAGTPDSVITADLMPGVTRLVVQREGPNVLNVLIVDLRAESLRVESFRPMGLVPTSRQASLNDRRGHSVVGAINADFFNLNGWPVGNQVVNGEFALGIRSGRSHLLIDERGRPHIARVDFDGWLRTRDGKQYEIAGVNDVHQNNAIILHTSFSDTTMNSGGPGKFFPLRLIDAMWLAGDTVRMVVDERSSRTLRDMAKREATLWIGAGSTVWGAREDLRSGDTILIYLGFRPFQKKIVAAVGGMGMIVSAGKFVDDSVNVSERASLSFLKSRHPRTFAGFDRDTTRLFFCTVDGRQPTSVGMSFREMADFLLSLGVSDALNFDGGGSTTMVIRGSIVNSPSDRTGERPVANSLQLIKIGPQKDAK
jgi:hypothetical protein